MNEELERDAVRLEETRENSLSFLRKRKKWTVILLSLAWVFELGFFVLMLWFMDIHNRDHWFMLFVALFIYCPLVTLVWRNTFKIDNLFYRLAHEFKYNSDTA